MDVRMVGQGRAPGVQHGGDTETRAESLGIGGDGEQGVGGELLFCTQIREISKSCHIL